MNIFQDLETIGQNILNFFKKVPQEAQDILTDTNKFLNIVKVISTSAPAQTVIDLAEAFFPGVAGLVNGAEAILEKLLGLTAGTPGQLLLQATQKAQSLTGAAKVAAFSNIATAIASTANDLKGGTLTPQQIISSNQLVHDPTILGTSTTDIVAEPAPGTKLDDGNIEMPASAATA